MCTAKLQHCTGRIVQPIRYVPGFSLSAAKQKFVTPYPPPRINIYQQRNKTTSLFRVLYLRGDLPCQRDFRKLKTRNAYLQWKTPPQELDYDYYLPIFFDGLAEQEYPYSFTARYGIHDMLALGGHKILPVLPKLIQRLRTAIVTKNPSVILAALRVIQHLIICNPCIGKALVPYYRQLLPSLHMFLYCNVNLLDGIDYDRVEKLGDVINQTLQMMERCGGPDSFINIKYIIPTYESAVNN